MPIDKFKKHLFEFRDQAVLWNNLQRYILGKPRARPILNLL